MAWHNTLGNLIARAGRRFVSAGEILSREGLAGVRKRLAGHRPKPMSEILWVPPSVLPTDADFEATQNVKPEEYQQSLKMDPGEFDRLSKLGHPAYARLVAAFDRLAGKGNDTDFRRYAWYHTVELPNGLVTPGALDYRLVLDRYGFPDDLKGKSVLDVGSGTGFFAFEFERRGAEVTSVDLPSIADWDMPAGEDKEISLREMLKHYSANSVEEVTRLHIEGPFDFCRQARKSQVKRVHSTIYDVSAEKVGRKSFDVVFLGDILEHTFSPLKALSSVAPLCHGTLILSSLYPMKIEAEPVMFYVGGDKRRYDNRTWWYPSKLLLTQMLRRLGFGEIRESGYFAGEVVTDIDAGQYRRTILHATKKV